MATHPMGPKKHPLQTDADQIRDGVDTRVRFCACGTAIGPRAKRCDRCRCRLAQARYGRTEKGKATLARYSRSPAKQASNARYTASPLGQRTRAALNTRRIFVGSNYRGRAQSLEQAAAIRTHIQERLRAFERQQTRA